jgi:photosystem II stability/assembly factor-like uncharacterized protein
MIWVLDPDGRLYRSSDGGANWSELTENLNEFSNSEVATFIHFEPASGILYHGSRHGLLRSFDNGATWTRVEMPLAPESLAPTAMIADRENPLKLYVAVGDQMYISEDGGATWKGVQVSLNGIVSTILINPENTQELFIGLRN